MHGFAVRGLRSDYSPKCRSASWPGGSSETGDYGRQINYSVDPVETAISFREAGASWMHIVDLDGAKEGRPVQTELIGR